MDQIKKSLIQIIKEMILYNIPFLKEEEVFTWCMMQKAQARIKGKSFEDYAAPVRSTFRLYEVYERLTENG